MCHWTQHAQQPRILPHCVGQERPILSSLNGLDTQGTLLCNRWYNPFNEGWANTSYWPLPRQNVDLFQVLSLLALVPANVLTRLRYFIEQIFLCLRLGVCFISKFVNILCNDRLALCTNRVKAYSNVSVKHICS